MTISIVFNDPTQNWNLLAYVFTSVVHWKLNAIWPDTLNWLKVLPTHLKETSFNFVCIYFKDTDRERIYFLNISVSRALSGHKNMSDTISFVRSSFYFEVKASFKIYDFFNNIHGSCFRRNTGSKLKMTLHKICQNTGFHWPIYSCIRLEPTIVSFSTASRFGVRTYFLQRIALWPFLILNKIGIAIYGDNNTL